MSEETKYACCSGNVGLFSCSGASNVGQLSNQVVIELNDREVGKMMCAVGIGGKVPGLVRSAEGCDRIIAIDGCPLECTKKALELSNINIDRHIILTDLGMTKNKDLKVSESDVSEAFDKISEIISN
ncbi:putative zinc-binding protein [Methanococcoides alaskense]|uniref:Metal-binding protein n=1 Tax=Methanococcoides alaskense TaxID=325778 RepID=A0AA90U0Y1_9EURY|nr:putative zinc-binding protein [Methanococcoides alaskense]MDR6223938.1 putative metal-binding protein [Methanococcoides alaskense]